jgi:flagellar FliL protein
MADAAPAKGEKATKEGAEDVKKGGKGKLFLVLGLVLLLLGGGGAGGYWYFVMRPAALAAASHEGAGEAEKKKEHDGESAALKFDPFVVNLADEGGARYLRVGLSLVIEGAEEEAKELEESKVKLLRIRSAVLELLSQQVAETVVTPEGKQHLKEAIEKQASSILEPTEVIDVLFTEFVVQF